MNKFIPLLSLSLALAMTSGCVRQSPSATNSRGSYALGQSAAPYNQATDTRPHSVVYPEVTKQLALIMVKGCLEKPIPPNVSAAINNEYCTCAGQEAASRLIASDGASQELSSGNPTDEQRSRLFDQPAAMCLAKVRQNHPEIF